MQNMHDQLAEYLNALGRDECYRIDAVLKTSPYETTERVFFIGANGAEQGPFVRKRFSLDSGLGLAYERLQKAQKQGRRFLHVPRIIECYATECERVVVMEHVVGETLADTVFRRDPSVELARDVFPRLCDAAIELHEGFDPPIIHRDLKPSNVMISDESLTLIDFGIARSHNPSAEQDTQFFGTRSYAPPEQFGYGQTDERSDVYALGMLLYYCLTENTPDVEIVNSKFEDSRIPKELREVLVRATAFDPKDRYCSVRELRDSFIRAAEAHASARLTPSPPNGEPVIPALTPESPAAENFPAPDPDTQIIPSRSINDRRRSRNHAVPIGLGIVWDVLLVLVWVLFLMACVVYTIDPDGANANTMPTWCRAAFSFTFFGVGGAAFIYLFMDKRLLRKYIHPLRNISRKHEKIACILIIIISFILCCVYVAIAKTFST